MNVAILKSIGTNYKLEYTSLQKPVEKKGHAVVQVLYCGVNHLDFLIATGRRPGPKRLPHILGSEIVGKIISTDTNSGFKMGDHVAVYPWIYCNECTLCREGHPQICENGGTIGRTTQGGYSEYVSVPVRNLIKISKKLSPDAVCSITLTGTTAYHLIQRARIPDNSLVLLTGATGGVGTLVIQLLKQKKCKIVVTTSSKSKVTKLKNLSVDDVLMLNQFPINVKKKYPAGIPYIIDTVGGKVWSGCVELLSKHGNMAFCSTTLEDMGTLHIGSAFAREINLCGSYGGTIPDLKAVIKLLEKGSLQPQIDSIIPFKNAHEALLKLARKKVFGKILLKI